MTNAFDRHRIFRLTDRWVSLSVFFILLITYWLTVPPTVSFWDCPEYVTAAVRLEPGHPPGNPMWMLVERMVTLFVPGKYAALAVNLSSGLFTALAGMLLAKCIFIGAVWILKTRDGIRRRLHAFYAGGAAFIGALAFGWCDSTWYSAVEAEVYAMSVFLTALSIWLMLKWARAQSLTLAWRYLILLAYIFGLSLGVHQLNLLVIPALAIVWALRRGIHSIWRIAVIFFVALAAVGCILVGMMPSTIALAAELELFTVNHLGWAPLSGVVAYVLLLGLSLIAALAVTRLSSNRGALSIAIFPPVFLSGLFIFAGNFLVGAAVSLLVAMIIVRASYFKPHRLNLMMWMLAMLLMGYSSYAIIPIRGNIPAPPNAAMPGNPFSFASYQAREQYGAAPLLYGQTPYSRPMFIEEMGDDSIAKYRRYLNEPATRQVEPLLPGAVMRSPGNMPIPLNSTDSTVNADAFAKGKDAYVVRGYSARQVLTPELNMWFPRITSRDPQDLPSYASWAGMNEEDMVKVEISEAVDSTGNYVAKMGEDGKRTHPTALRPTCLQNLQYLFGYQIGYMYLRYLMWNFSGRQNDIPSTGEVEHGNFITGFLPVDNAMLQAENALPPHAGAENEGRNRYFMLPFLLGIWGIVWMIRSNWRGRIGCGVIAALFIMTGVAIVVYLNQTPGEPRERDYTFLGSYMAFAMWIGAGALGLSRTIAEALECIWKRRHGFRLRWMLVAATIGFLPSLAIAGLMLQQNYGDHDRSGRRVASRYAYNVLMSLEPNAVIFVDGDNYTFPLWYAQEVEGVRRDVRVINLSYLSSPRYAALVLGEWEDTPALQSVLKAPDIIYHAHMLDVASPMANNRINALDMLSKLKENPFTPVEASEISLTLASGDSIVLPATALSRNGDSRTFDFRKLMMLDIIASNAAPHSNVKRPIYWQKNVASGMYLKLQPYLTDRMMAYRLGTESSEKTDSSLIAIADRLLPPNDLPAEKVYMDRIPASMTARMRADITASAKRLLHNGHLNEALNIAMRLHNEYGNKPYTLQPVKMGDTVFVTPKEFGSLFQELADSLRMRQSSSSYLPENKEKLPKDKEKLRKDREKLPKDKEKRPEDKENLLKDKEISADSLEKIGNKIISESEARSRAWGHYKKTLSPSMRLNMSKSP